MTERSAEAAARWREAKQRAKDLRDELSEAVRADRAEGASLNDLATVLGVSREAVRKMTGDPDDRMDFDSTRDVRCPRCGAGPGEKCIKPRGWFHAERHDRRIAAHRGQLDDLSDDEMTAMAGKLLGS